jgi:phenylpropionate dioxygenase-like ring-hydroxylating dioxygenase large terminal subunit
MLNDPVLVNDWHPVATVKQLEETNVLAVRLLGEDLVLWRINDQTMAWQDLCIHRGTRLSLGQIVEGDKLECPYHGWIYDADGKCLRIPAHPEQTAPQKAVAETYQARERYGLVWVSLGEPENDIPPFPEWDDPAYRNVLCGPYGPFEASAPRAIENFLDVAHVPFVHGGILGDRAHAKIPNYEVTVGHDGIKTSVISIYQPDPYGTGVGEEVAYTYRVFRPLTAYLDKLAKDGTRFSIFFAVTPHEATHSTVWMYYGLNEKYTISNEDLKTFNDSIIYADLPIIKSQRPELLPLDLQAELHLRSDRTAVAYRRWLQKLGLTIGTS